jgi:predicted SnoaL-like aldol condensation-catalyzing enzyme
MSTSSPESALEQNKRLALRWLDEVWNQGRRETIRELFAKTGVYHRGASEYRGPAGFMHFYDIISAQFSQLSIKPIVSVAEADLVCIHWSTAALFTTTRTPVHFTGTSIWRIKDGQFVEAWQNWDAAGLASQIPGFVAP